MDTIGFFDDLLFLLQHIYAKPEVAVQRWTQIACNDYQIPLALISGTLINFDLPSCSNGLLLRDKAEYQAVGDIVKNSRLSEVLDLNVQERRVRYRDSIPPSLKEEISRFIATNSSGCT